MIRSVNPDCELMKAEPQLDPWFTLTELHCSPALHLNLWTYDSLSNICLSGCVLAQHHLHDWHIVGTQ